MYVIASIDFVYVSIATFTALLHLFALIFVSLLNYIKVLLLNGSMTFVYRDIRVQS